MTNMPVKLRSILIAAALVAATALPMRASGQAAAPSDSAAVIAVVQRLFDAMATRDTASARALLLPGARVVSVRTGSGPAVPRVQSDTAFVRSIGSATDVLHERMWNPLVRVHGGLADLWAPYDFHRGGRFSHCGVDSFALVRAPNGWLIAGITYTVEPTGCAPSPLGPPKAGS